MHLSHQIQKHLQILCIDIPERPVGSPGNQEAVQFFNETIQTFGFKTECPEFDCMDWTHGKVHLQAGNETFQAEVSPYAPACDVKAELVACSQIEQLEQMELNGKILMLYGEIAKEQIMPKNFPFYNPEDHQNIIRILEEKAPIAIICATGKNPELAGSLYPFPMFEDGDFNIPSVYMKDVDGEKLLKYADQTITLQYESIRIPSKGSNVIAQKGNPDSPKIVICAHIDAKKGTPGALDNGGGTAVLLALAELLKDYQGTDCIEIIAFNGEDYYDAPGQKQYFEQNQNNLNRIKLAVNLDGIGYKEGKTHYSFYECSDEMADQIRKELNTIQEISDGPEWFQGDHMIFAMHQVPAMAFAPAKWEFLTRKITHTKKDTIDLIDMEKLARTATALRKIIEYIPGGLNI